MRWVAPTEKDDATRAESRALFPAAQGLAQLMAVAETVRQARETR